MTLSSQGLQSAVGSARRLPEAPARHLVQMLPEGRCPCCLRTAPRKGLAFENATLSSPPKRRHKLHTAYPHIPHEGSFIPLRRLSPKSPPAFRGPPCDGCDDCDGIFDTAPTLILIVTTVTIVTLPVPACPD